MKILNVLSNRLVLVGLISMLMIWAAAEAGVEPTNLLPNASFELPFGPEKHDWIRYNPGHGAPTNWTDMVNPLTVKLAATGQAPEVVPVIRTAAERRLPVLIHTFQRTGPNLPGEVTLAEFAALAERFPAAALIGAHAGGNWRHSIGVLRDRALNASVDISGCFPEKGMVEALVKEHEVEATFGRLIEHRGHVGGQVVLKLVD